MKIKNLGLKVSLIVALMIAAIIMIIVYIVSVQSDALVADLAAKEAKASNIALVKEVQSLQTEAFMHAKIISSSNRVVNAVTSGDDVALKTALLEMNEGIDTVMVTDAEGTVLARAHSDQKGDNVLSQRIVSTTLSTGTGTGTIAKGTTVGLATRGSAVIEDDSGNIIGAVICGHDLSNPQYVDSIKETNSCEATIFDGDTRLMTTLMDETGSRVVGTKASDTVIDTVIRQKQEYSLQISLFSREYFSHYSPLVIDGEVLGMLFTGVLIEDALMGQQAMMRWVLTAGIICGLAAILGVLIFNIFAVGRPLKKIGAFAEKIRSGDLGVSSSSASTIDVRSSDEVGVMARALEQAYTQLRGYVGEIKDRMQNLVEGDLTEESTYDFQGDFILIKDSINEHIRNLGQTMTEINVSSAQVSMGSKQVADGAQTLAQGATEQAASVEELSSSIARIAERTKENAGTADKTAMLSATIKENAEKGSFQMDEMITAVGAINEASKNIGKIIKTIDDIAFQTNILALNAAVEAARAGQHGKGFAVVAEEVRNLASKSAEAARDTGDMIRNSIDKAELGARIAEETAKSLSAIVSGISESSRLVAEIAQSSEEQALGISQINTGIDQVAQVVQQNSATSEESAAASEQMSGQADMLQQLIGQFTLKDSGAARPGLSSGSFNADSVKRQLTMPEKHGDAFSDSGHYGKY